MRSLHNVEPSHFRKGEYVGYSLGVWRIFRYGRGRQTWLAVHRLSQFPEISARTLTEISEKLEKVCD